VGEDLAGQISVSWEDTKSVQEWLDGQPHQLWKQTFEEQGVLVSSVLLDKYVDMFFLILKFCCLVLFISNCMTLLFS